MKLAKKKSPEVKKEKEVSPKPKQAATSVSATASKAKAASTKLAPKKVVKKIAYCYRQEGIFAFFIDLQGNDP